MTTHFICLALATILYTVFFVLYSIIYFYGPNRGAHLRILIAENYFYLAKDFAWFFTHVFMLKIFCTYGRALENNQENLIKKKLINGFETEENLAYQRRL